MRFPIGAGCVLWTAWTVGGAGGLAAFLRRVRGSAGTRRWGLLEMGLDVPAPSTV